LSYADAFKSAPDGYCPHMFSLKRRVYYLSTTDAKYLIFDTFVSVFVS